MCHVYDLRRAKSHVVSLINTLCMWYLHLVKKKKKKTLSQPQEKRKWYDRYRVWVVSGRLNISCHDERDDNLSGEWVGMKCRVLGRFLVCYSPGGTTSKHRTCRTTAAASILSGKLNQQRKEKTLQKRHYQREKRHWEFRQMELKHLDSQISGGVEGQINTAYEV